MIFNSFGDVQSLNEPNLVSASNLSFTGQCTKPKYSSFPGWYSESKRSFLDRLPADFFLLSLCLFGALIIIWFSPHCGRTQKFKTPLLRTQNSKVFPLKPGVGQNIVTYASPTARDFFLASFYPPGLFSCIFSETSFNFFSVGPLSKKDHPTRHEQLVQVPVLSACGI